MMKIFKKCFTCLIQYLLAQWYMLILASAYWVLALKLEGETYYALHLKRSLNFVQKALVKRKASSIAQVSNLRKIKT